MVPKAESAIKVVVIASLLLLAFFQTVIDSRRAISKSFALNQENSDSNKESIGFDMSFPIVNKSALSYEVEEAEIFLKLPTWSNGYKNCSDPESEVSCFEVVRAYKAIKKYEESVKAQKTKGYVIVQISKQQLADKMSKLYQGLSIAMATGRRVRVKSDDFPFELPDYFESPPESYNGYIVPHDYKAGCANLNTNQENIILADSSWPQVMYTHHEVAPFLRNNFGFHAAYFLGNYLFGSTQKPIAKCFNSKYEFGVEAWDFHSYSLLSPGRFEGYVGRCGVAGNAFVVSNKQPDNFAFGSLNEPFYLTDETSLVCGLRKLISSKNIIHTFGSRYGWWAQALHGHKGGFVNSIDNLCINASVSQSASLWHTYCPREFDFIFRTNNRLYICGPNSFDVQLYIDYLLW